MVLEFQYNHISHGGVFHVAIIKDQFKNNKCVLKSLKTFTDIWVQKWATSKTRWTYFPVQNRINDIIYKGIKCQYQNFGAKATTGHTVTQSYLYKFKILWKNCKLMEETLIFSWNAQNPISSGKNWSPNSTVKTLTQNYGP